jgi:hypothetical protein
MKIDNKTIFHDNEVKKIVEFAMHPLVKHCIDKFKMKIEFRVRTGNGATGDTTSNGKQWLIQLQVPYLESKYPFDERDREHRSRVDIVQTHYRKQTGDGTFDYIPTLVLSREEHLLHCAAHEIYHVAQHLANKFNEHKDGENAKVIPFSDKEADRYAITKQRKWRKSKQQYVYFLPENIPTVIEPK